MTRHNLHTSSNLFWRTALICLSIQRSLVMHDCVQFTHDWMISLNMYKLLQEELNPQGFSGLRPCWYPEGIQNRLVLQYTTRHHAIPQQTKAPCTTPHRSTGCWVGGQGMGIRSVLGHQQQAQYTVLSKNVLGVYIKKKKMAYGKPLKFNTQIILKLKNKCNTT